MVNVHGSDQTKITVNYFDFEAEKDGMDVGFGLYIDEENLDVVKDTTYDDSYRLNTTVFDRATFWFTISTDRNILSGGYNLTFSSGETLHFTSADYTSIGKANLFNAMNKVNAQKQYTLLPQAHCFNGH